MKESAPREERRRQVRSPRRSRAVEEEEAYGLIGHLLAPLTTRIQPETADALKRAYLEQKLRRRRPATQQEIIETALSDWLARNGYLDGKGVSRG